MDYRVRTKGLGLGLTQGQGVWDKDRDIRMKASWWDMLGGLDKKKRKVGQKKDQASTESCRVKKGWRPQDNKQGFGGGQEDKDFRTSMGTDSKNPRRYEFFNV